MTIDTPKTLDGLSTQPEPPTAVGLGVVGWLRWGWRQLTSMRTALLLLFLVAVASIPGSFFPQRGVSPVRVNQWIAESPFWGPIWDRLGMFDVFAAPWFAAIYVLLFVSLAGCVIPRAWAHAKMLRARPPAVPRRLTRLPQHRAWEVDSTHADAALAAAAAHLRKGRWRVDVAEYDGATGVGSVAAEKGFARETGNLLFHLSLLALLFAVGYGALFGWRGTVVVRQGTGFSNTLTQYDSFSPGRLVNTEALTPFSFKLKDFDVDFQRGGDQNGAPRRFAATLDWTERPGAPVQRSVVEVNSPLEVGGVKVFLLGHGYAPHITIKDKTGTVVFSDTVVFLPQDTSFASTGVIKLPDVEGGLGFKGVFLPTAALVPGQGPISTFPAPDDPALFFTVYGGDLGMNSGVPQSVYSLDTTDLKRLDSRAPLRVGETWTLKNGQATVTFDSVERFGSFVVAEDPGKGPALIAAVGAIAGLLLSLFVTRRRAWVKVSVGEQGRTLVEVAGLARSEAPGLKSEIDDLAAAVAGQAPPLSSDSVRSDPLDRLDESTPGAPQEESRP